MSGNANKIVKPRQKDAMNRLETARDRAKDALSTYRIELAILHSPRVMVINELIKKLDKSYFEEITS